MNSYDRNLIEQHTRELEKANGKKELSLTGTIAYAVAGFIILVKFAECFKNFL